MIGHVVSRGRSRDRSEREGERREGERERERERLFERSFRERGRERGRSRERDRKIEIDRRGTVRSQEEGFKSCCFERHRFGGAHMRERSFREVTAREKGRER